MEPKIRENKFYLKRQHSAYYYMKRILGLMIAIGSAIAYYYYQNQTHNNVNQEDNFYLETRNIEQLAEDKDLNNLSTRKNITEKEEELEMKKEELINNHIDNIENKTVNQVEILPIKHHIKLKSFLNRIINFPLFLKERRRKIKRNVLDQISKCNELQREEFYDFYLNRNIVVVGFNYELTDGLERMVGNKLCSKTNLASVYLENKNPSSCLLFKNLSVQSYINQNFTLKIEFYLYKKSSNKVELNKQKTIVLEPWQTTSDSQQYLTEHIKFHSQSNHLGRFLRVCDVYRKEEFSSIESNRMVVKFEVTSSKNKFKFCLDGVFQIDMA